MVNVGPLTAEIGRGVWGTPANFNGFRVLALLLHRRRQTEESNNARCLVVSWAGTLYIHFSGSCVVTEFCQVQNSLCVKSCVLLYWRRYCTTLEQWASAKLSGIGTRNEITELSLIESATHIPRAAITLDIGPHSSSTSCGFVAHQVVQQNSTQQV